MKTLLRGVAILALGLGVGGASAYGVSMLNIDPVAMLGPKSEFVPAERLTAPLVFEDGRLAAYIAFTAQLEVPSHQASAVRNRLPMLMHAVNLRTYREPLASGPDGMIPDIGKLREVIVEASAETYGKGVVQRVVVTQATPI